jgi:hypothetical protein
VKAIETDKATMAAFDAKGQPLRYAPPEEMAAIIARLLGGQLSPDKVKAIDEVIMKKYY